MPNFEFTAATSNAELFRCVREHLKTDSNNTEKENQNKQNDGPVVRLFCRGEELPDDGTGVIKLFDSGVVDNSVLSVVVVPDGAAQLQTSKLMLTLCKAANDDPR